MPKNVKGRDLSKQKFGKWTVNCFGGWTSDLSALWDCTCECGTNRLVAGRNLKSGKSTCCGCVKRARSVSRLGEYYTGVAAIHTKEYMAWENMKQRCMNPNASYYDNYGGRGIKVCQKWIDSFDAFLGDVGLAPSGNHSIGRIDNDGNYEPGNCRWETDREQSNNTTKSYKLEYQGKTQTITQWSRELGVTASRLRNRLEAGWSIENAIKTPPQQRNRTLTYNKETRTISGWAKHLGINEITLRDRLSRGWTPDRALSETPQSRSSTSATQSDPDEHGC